MMKPDPAIQASLPDKTEESKPILNEAREEAEELREFLSLIDRLPTEYQPDFYRAMQKLVVGFERRQRILGYIQDSLGQMNLDLKYLIFDLEATRRERDDYHRQLLDFKQE